MGLHFNHKPTYLLMLLERHKYICPPISLQHLTPSISLYHVRAFVPGVITEPFTGLSLIPTSLLLIFHSCSNNPKIKMEILWLQASEMNNKTNRGESIMGVYMCMYICIYNIDIFFVKNPLLLKLILLGDDEC